MHYTIKLLFLISFCAAKPVLNGTNNENTKEIIIKDTSSRIDGDNDGGLLNTSSSKIVQVVADADQTGSPSNIVNITQEKSTGVVVTSKDNARLEQEGIPSKILTVYDNSQNKAGSFLNVEPIVDTISEHEKYGNTGDKFYPIGRAIVNGYEGFSNILNKILDTPVEVAKQFSRGLTQTLNAVGGKIVGL